MKTIGIKLADGSFYSIMQEGEPCKKTLGLTTVKDNQTKIIVDLYRSKTNSIDDAEYVDTLQIDGLVPKPNGEADISLNISLDENNELHAELNDAETGADTTVTVELISRTLEERLEPTNFEVSEEVHDTIEQEFNPNPETTKTKAVGGGLLAAAAMLQNKKEDSEKEEKIEKTENVEEIEEIVPEFDNVESENKEISDESIEETNNFDANDSDTDFDLPDFDNQFETENADSAKEDNFGFNDSQTVLDDAFAENVEEDSKKEDDFEIPEINDTELGDFNEESSTNDDIFSFDDNQEAEINNSDFDKSVEKPIEPTNSNPTSLKFDNLYDKETLEGKSDYEEESDNSKKKTKVSVIICIICAVICLIATALILFIIPSKYNLLNKKTETKQEEFVEIPEQIEIPPVEETVPEPEVIPEETQAKEDEVVVIPEPEEIVPEVEEIPEVVPEDIEYKIKWGDTLWDISDTYYKNPWKYKKIAKDNKIKDPDYIISGTKIKIKPLE